MQSTPVKPAALEDKLRTYKELSGTGLQSTEEQAHTPDNRAPGKAGQHHNTSKPHKPHEVVNKFKCTYNPKLYCFKKYFMAWRWWRSSLIPALRRQKQVYVSEFEGCMVYKTSSRTGRPGLLHRETLFRIRKEKKSILCWVW